MTCGFSSLDLLVWWDSQQQVPVVLIPHAHLNIQDREPGLSSPDPILPPSLISRTVSADVKHHERLKRKKKKKTNTSYALEDAASSHSVALRPVLQQFPF